jgi:transposase
MGRKMIEVISLHDYTLEELLDKKRSLTSSYSFNILLAVTMRYQKVHTDEIARILGLSKPTILEYIHKWNEIGMEALEDHRGGSKSEFTDEMIDDLKDIIIHKCPADEGFSSFSWNCNLLAEYIEKKYNRRYSPEWIRRILIKNGYSYKKGQYKPTLSSAADQLAFKKNDGPSKYCRKFF